MAIQETTANLSATLAGLPLAERALLSALVERMRGLNDEDLARGAAGATARRPAQQLAPWETEYDRATETEEKAGKDPKDKDKKDKPKPSDPETEPY